MLPDMQRKEFTGSHLFVPPGTEPAAKYAAPDSPERRAVGDIGNRDLGLPARKASPKPIRVFGYKGR